MEQQVAVVIMGTNIIQEWVLHTRQLVLQRTLQLVVLPLTRKQEASMGVRDNHPHNIPTLPLLVQLPMDLVQPPMEQQPMEHPMDNILPLMALLIPMEQPMHRVPHKQPMGIHPLPNHKGLGVFLDPQRQVVIEGVRGMPKKKPSNENIIASKKNWKMKQRLPKLPYY
jgi:hypothetical protein